MTSLAGGTPGIILVAASQITFDIGTLGAIGGCAAALIGAFAVWRKIEPERKKLHAEALRLETEADAIEDRIRTSLLDDMERDRQRQRELTAQAEANEAKAAATLAQALSEHATALAQWKVERHDLINDLRESRLEVDALRREVDKLHSDIQTLRIKLDMAEGRREDDKRRPDVDR